MYLNIVSIFVKIPLILARKLWHALLHSSNQTSHIHEYTFFPRDKVEIEANNFATELLIDEKDILIYMREEFIYGTE